jgi:adenylate cyclase
MKKHALLSLLLSVFMTFAVLGLYLFGAFQGFENRTTDFHFRLRGNRTPSRDVVVIAADEKSIAQLGRWPWARNVHAQLVDWLTKAGAKAIVFDVLFLEPDKDKPWADARLGESAAKSGRVVFGMLLQKDQENEENYGKPTNPQWPIPPLRKKNVSMGFVNINPQTDGVTRKIPMWVEYDGRFLPSLSLSAWAVAQNRPADDALNDLAAPMDSLDNPWNEWLLNFPIGNYQTVDYEKSYLSYSYVDVLKGRKSPDLFRDKIVLVGGTAVALFDFIAAPNMPNFPGLLIHATALDNFLHKNFLRPVDFFWVMLLILLFGLGSGYLTARLPAWAGPLLAGFVLGYFVLCQALFSQRSVLLDFVAPSVSVVASYVLVFFYRFLTEKREKRWIKGTFSQYMSPKIIDFLTADPSRMKLGGEKREMTMFFSDLAGFTSIAETMGPSELVAILNEYLTDMSEIIMKHDGIVDKFMGDGIMAFWNAPLDQNEHAVLACRTALDSIQRLEIIRQEFAARKLPPIDCRIGINTGPAVVGNMGSKKRFDYTVMGDSVNLASRLEGANKPFHTRIMISEFTYEKAKDAVEVRELDLIRVPGKSIAIKVFELVTLKGALSEDQKKAFDLHQEGLYYYRDRKFKQAMEKMKKVLEILPQDGPAAAYIQRCEAYIAEPPPKDWDGVYKVTSK